jgi:hypothetical protein
LREGNSIPAEGSPYLLMANAPNASSLTSHTRKINRLGLPREIRRYPIAATINCRLQVQTAADAVSIMSSKIELHAV